MFPTTLSSLDGRTISGLKGEAMSALNLSSKDITGYDGTPVRRADDQEADIL